MFELLLLFKAGCYSLTQRHAIIAHSVNALRPLQNMSEQKRKILVTSALPYANGAIHIGHMLEFIWER